MSGENYPGYRFPNGNIVAFTEGIGLHYMNTKDTWYGSFGGCGVCGTSSPNHIIPRQVRYWDCDDGWKIGVLCDDCTNDVRDRGPQPNDFAFRGEDTEFESDVADTLAELGDLDAVASEFENFMEAFA